MGTSCNCSEQIETLEEAKKNLEMLEENFIPMPKELELTKTYSVNKITNQIYLGSFYASCSKEFLKSENITHILSLLNKEDELIQVFPDIIYKKIDVPDVPNFIILKCFKECFEFIENSSKILVHCQAGVSRSATIVIGYIMLKTKCKLNDAVSLVRKKRWLASPNHGFMRQLEMFETQLKKHNYDMSKINYI